MGARSVKPQVEVLQNFIGGAWVPSKTERVEDIPNPATGDLLARVPYSTVGDVEAAVAAAARAYPAWRDTPVVERARVMFRFRQVLEDHLEELALLVTQENGKTVEEAPGGEGPRGGGGGGGRGWEKDKLKNQ